MVGAAGPLRPLAEGSGRPLGALGLPPGWTARPLREQLLRALSAALHGAMADTAPLGAAFAVHVGHDPEAEGFDLLGTTQPDRRSAGVPASWWHGAGVELDKGRVQLRRGGPLAAAARELDSALALVDRRGVRRGRAQLVTLERLAQRRPGRAELGRGGVDAAELLGEPERPLGLATIGQEPARRVGRLALGLGEVPVRPGVLEGVAADTQLLGSLPQPDPAGELARLLGHRPVLPVGAGLGEPVGPQMATLGRNGAAEDAVVAVQGVGTTHRQVPARLLDLAARADLLGLAGLTTLPGLGEEPLGRHALAGGLVHPAQPALARNQRQPLLLVGGVALLGPQWPQHLPDAALTDAEHSGDRRGVQALAAVALGHLPELGDALGVGQLPAPQRRQGLRGVGAAHADLAGNRCRVEVVAVADFAGPPCLLDPLQRTASRR